MKMEKDSLQACFTNHSALRLASELYVDTVYIDKEWLVDIIENLLAAVHLPCQIPGRGCHVLVDLRGHTLRLAALLFQYSDSYVMIQCLYSARCSDTIQTTRPPFLLHARIDHPFSRCFISL